MLQPVLVLVAWSIVMLVWLYVLRLPMLFTYALSRPTLVDGEATRSLSAPVQWPADNYNNLMEQPTVFYALVAYSYLAGQQNPVNLALAWAYVALRVVHSLIQATVNLVLLRFGVFALGTLVLAVLAGRDVWALF